MDISRKQRENKKGMTVHQEGELVWLSFPLLDECREILHGFSTRLGGVSREHLESMNLSFSRGDDRENVMENFRRIAGAIGFSYENLVFTDQTHTANIRKVTAKDRGKGIVVPRDYTDVDGIITDEPGLVLAAFFADCVPLYFVDPVHRAIGLSHSGWRGTVEKIGRATVETMGREYGSRPQDMLAAIGPSICMDCYEVSEDVILAFQENFSKKDRDSLFYRKENGKYQLDLWKANEIIMKEAGILPENIAVTDICTCCNPKLLYSHRASKGMRGNLAAFLSIR